MRTFGKLVGFVIVGLTCWLAYVFISSFKLADPSVQSAIIAAGVAVSSLAFAAWKERSRSIKEAHREKKIEVYSKFYDLMFRLMAATKSGHEINLNDPAEKFQEIWFSIARGVIFYGSPEVVNSFAAISAPSSNTDPTTVMRKIGRVLLAMRDDIGLSNKGINELSIHQVYVTDDLASLGEKI